MVDPTAFWESALLCFTRCAPNGSWRDDVQPESDDDDESSEEGDNGK